MGNPHFVIFVDTFQNRWQQQAAIIGAQPQFPQGTNMEYVIVRKRMKSKSGYLNAELERRNLRALGRARRQ